MNQRHFVLNRHIRKGGVWSDWELLSEEDSFDKALAELMRFKQDLYAHAGADGEKREEFRVWSGSKTKLDSFLHAQKVAREQAVAARN